MKSVVRLAFQILRLLRMWTKEIKYKHFQQYMKTTSRDTKLVNQTFHMELLAIFSRKMSARKFSTIKV
jgi:hypothetical protein